jgi:ubiquilin
MLENPELMRQMIMANPGIRRMVENNPEIGHALSDPSTLRQMTAMMRNPAMMQEMVRHQDRAMMNIEGMPGGLDYLRRMMTDLDAATAPEPAAPTATGGGDNPFAALFGGAPAAPRATTTATDTPSTGARRERTFTTRRSSLALPDPMPNPWATPSAGAPPANPFAGLGLGAGGMGMDHMAQMLENPAMREMLTTVMQNPAMMQAVTSSARTCASAQSTHEHVDSGDGCQSVRAERPNTAATVAESRDAAAAG